MFCKNCGKEISDDSKFCQFCGKNISNDASDENYVKKQNWIVGVIIVFVILLVFINIDDTDTNSNYTSNYLQQSNVISNQENKVDKSIPLEYRNALESAKSYSNHAHMSKKNIYEQLTSEFGEGFTEEAAQYAIDNLNADYKYNALKSAESYSSHAHMSKKNIYEQLTSEFGEGFTEDEAKYAIEHLK